MKRVVDEAEVEKLIDDKNVKLSQTELQRIAKRIDKEMKEAAKNLEFEEAARLRDLLVSIKGRLRS